MLEGRMGRWIVGHEDRLRRVGAERVFGGCGATQGNVALSNPHEAVIFEEDLATDVLEIIAIVSARSYGHHARKNQPLPDRMHDAVT